jgi:hypothetical protein
VRAHSELIPTSALLQGLRLPLTYRVLDLEPGSAAESVMREEKAVVSVGVGDLAARAGSRVALSRLISIFRFKLTLTAVKLRVVS